MPLSLAALRASPEGCGSGTQAFSWAPTAGGGGKGAAAAVECSGRTVLPTRPVHVNLACKLVAGV